ncbi:MAG: histidine phosphatase family protein [Pirellulaceae bacterium]|nr:histidine phosphatase family protein [Pirellulaceae bacterium]
MMATLLILRHAKSDWDDPSLADHDRPLNKRGRRDAPRIGRLLVERSLVPRQVFTSSAVRARATAEMVVQECGIAESQVVVAPQLYLAGPETYLDYLRWHAVADGPVMVVGHNPGLESLLHVLTGAHEHLPTAALAHVTLELAAWNDLSQLTPARLESIYRPKELED